jgi:hypothetical protein
MEIIAPLVGVTFRGAGCRDIVKRLTPDDGELLTLETEPLNEYDSNAVKVIYQPSGDHIGYLAKENNQQVFAALEAGEQLKVQIVGFENSIKPVLLITNGQALAHEPEAEDQEPLDHDMTGQLGQD